MDSLGCYLRRIREEKGISQKDVYEKVGITDSKLSRLENNYYSEPSPSALKKLAALYNVSIVDLFIKAGYLTYEALNICPQIFHGIDKLTESDRKHIQGQIDYIIQKRE